MILQTNDYSIFKKHEANRDINQPNLRNLLASIQANNMLEINPIIVNDNFEIMDGQHRFEAAKILNLPIFYIISNKCYDEDIILLNCNKMTWKANDYINYYISKGNLNYLKLSEFLKKHEYNLSCALILLGQDGGSNNKCLKQGKYKFPANLDKANKRIFQIRNVQKLLQTKMINYTDFIATSNFLKVLSAFLSYENVFFDVFMKKLELNMQWIRPCSRMEALRDIFVRIYNYKNQNPIV